MNAEQRHTASDLWTKPTDGLGQRSKFRSEACGKAAQRGVPPCCRRHRHGQTFAVTTNYNMQRTHLGLPDLLHFTVNPLVQPPSPASRISLSETGNRTGIARRLSGTHQLRGIVRENARLRARAVTSAGRRDDRRTFAFRRRRSYRRSGRRSCATGRTWA